MEHAFFTEAKMTKRNNLVELARFLFSILVVGYHIQMTFLGDDIKKSFDYDSRQLKY